MNEDDIVTIGFGSFTDQRKMLELIAEWRKKRSILTADRDAWKALALREHSGHCLMGSGHACAEYCEYWHDEILQNTEEYKIATKTPTAISAEMMVRLTEEHDKWREMADRLYWHLSQLCMENYKNRYEDKMPCAGCYDATADYRSLTSQCLLTGTSRPQ